MCNAFSHMTTAQWLCLDEKDAERPRWKNKCLQKCILELCSGPKHKHGERLFNRRCCNDAATGYGSFFCSENMLAVKDFLRLHEFHLVILEMQQDGTCEEFILGSGDHCLGNVFWDIQKKHASIVPSDLDVDTFETCVSSEPWTRSAVGTESSTHCCLKHEDKDSKKNTAEDETPVMSLNPRQEEMRRVFREAMEDRKKYNDDLKTGADLQKQGARSIAENDPMPPATSRVLRAFQASKNATRARSLPDKECTSLPEASPTHEEIMEHKKYRHNLLLNTIGKLKQRRKGRNSKKELKKKKKPRTFSQTASAIRRRQLRKYMKSDAENLKSEYALFHSLDIDDRGEPTTRESGPLPPRQQLRQRARKFLNYRYNPYRGYQNNASAVLNSADLSAVSFKDVQEQDLCRASANDLRRCCKEIGQHFV